MNFKMFELKKHLEHCAPKVSIENEKLYITHQFSPWEYNMFQYFYFYKLVILR